MSKIVISHSEVDQFLSCERKHYYGFGRRLQRKTASTSLRRGTMGHQILDIYYQAIKDGFTTEQARQSGMERFVHFIQEPDVDVSLLADLQDLLTRYFDYAPTLDAGYKVLYVEQEFRLPLTENIEYPYKPDLIMEHTATGKIKVIDHKFIYNFYNIDDMRISPQLPKYMGALRANGIKVTDGVYNMLRWRKVKDQSPEANFKRESVPINNTRIAITFQEQISAMTRIAAVKALPLSEWQSHVLRTASSFNCSHCSFLDLCTTELAGEDSSLIQAHDFEPNKYGYDLVKKDVEV